MSKDVGFRLLQLLLGFLTIWFNARRCVDIFKYTKNLNREDQYKRSFKEFRSYFLYLIFWSMYTGFTLCQLGEEVN
jgi:phosphate starvation-inducible membrane PsiE